MKQPKLLSLVVLAGSWLASVGLAGAAPIELHYLHWSKNAQLADEISAFNKSQTRIHVDLEFNKNYDSLMLQLAAGKGPDVFSTHATYKFPLINKDLRKWTLDLTPLLERDKSQLSWDQLPAPTRAYNMSLMDGHWWGIPRFAHLGELIVYRPDLFAKAGLTAPAADWTLDDMVAIAKKLTTDNNGDGKVDVHGLTSASGGRPKDDPYVRMLGAYFYNADGSRFMYQDPTFRNGVQFMNQLYRDGIVGGNRHSLINGTAAMMPSTSNLIYLMDAHSAGVKQLGVQLWPIDPATGSRGVQEVDSEYVSINAHISPEKQAAAWEVIKFLVGEAGVSAAYNDLGLLQMPPAQINLARKYFFNLAPPYSSLGVDLSLYAKNIPYLQNRVDLPRVGFNRARSIITGAMKKIVAGSSAPLPAIDAIGPQVNAVIQAAASH